jgi:nicotinamide/nicotinate riboside kinase
MLPTLQGVDAKNWDVPSAIDWSQMLKVLRDVKRIGSIPLDCISRGDWHEPGDIPIDDNRVVAWKARFEDIKQHCLVAANIKVIWVLVEGFMLYWDQVCISS